MGGKKQRRCSEEKRVRDAQSAVTEEKKKNMHVLKMGAKIVRRPNRRLSHATSGVSFRVSTHLIPPPLFTRKRHTPNVVPKTVPSWRSGFRDDETFCSQQAKSQHTGLTPPSRRGYGGGKSDSQSLRATTMRRRSSGRFDRSSLPESLLSCTNKNRRRS